MNQEQDWREVARQLGNPQGEAGIKTAERMQENNAGMIRKTIDILEIGNNERILEIGFGNGTHLPYILSQAADVVYTGVDISPTMVAEALKHNKVAAEKNSAQFLLNNGTHLPFESESFEHIFTVNTVYFWESPGSYLMEMLRVLTNGGCLALAFAPASFMKQLPFTEFGFRLYEENELTNLFTEAGFSIAKVEQVEEALLVNGETMKRSYTIIKGRKG